MTAPAPLGLMTLNEMAVYLNRPLSTVQWWAHRVRLFPIYHVGRRVMVKRSDVDAFVQRGFRPAVTAVPQRKRRMG